MAVKLRERKPGEWWLYVDHKGKRFAKKIGNDKRTANSIKREVEKRLASGDLKIMPEEPPDKGPTLEKYAEQYLNNVEPTLKPSTWTDYVGNFRLHITPALGKLHLVDLTRRHVKDLALSLRRKGLSPKSVRKVVGTLSACLAEAIEDELLAANPALQLRKVYRSPEFNAGDKHRHVNALTRDELAHLLQTAQTHAIERGRKIVAVAYPFRPYHPFLLTLARTGLRLGECIALKWGDLDWHGGFIEVQRALVRGMLTTTKNKKRRRVDMSTQLQQTLRAVHDERFGRVVALDADAQARREAEQARADAWVFTDGNGGTLDPDNFRSRIYEPLLEAAKLRAIRIHDLRHTFASQLIEAGKELQYVQEQLGHHSASFTLAVYGHLLPRNRRGEVDCLDTDATIRNPSATDPETPESAEMKKAS